MIVVLMCNDVADLWMTEHCLINYTFKKKKTLKRQAHVHETDQHYKVPHLANYQ